MDKIVIFPLPTLSFNAESIQRCTSKLLLVTWPAGSSIALNGTFKSHNNILKFSIIHISAINILKCPPSNFKLVGHKKKKARLVFGYPSLQ